MTVNAYPNNDTNIVIMAAPKGKPAEPSPTVKL